MYGMPAWRHSSLKLSEAAVSSALRSTGQSRKRSQDGDGPSVRERFSVGGSGTLGERGRLEDEGFSFDMKNLEFGEGEGETRDDLNRTRYPPLDSLCASAFNRVDVPTAGFEYKQTIPASQATQLYWWHSLPNP